MKFYQLGFRYLQRKKGKTILLLIVLILVNSMILGTSMILRTTNESKQAMQEKTNSKIVAEITSKDSKITENEVNKIETLEDVSAINRIGRQDVFPASFAPVTLNTSTNEENLKIALLSYDDLEEDALILLFLVTDDSETLTSLLLSFLLLQPARNRTQITAIVAIELNFFNMFSVLLKNFFLKCDVFL